MKSTLIVSNVVIYALIGAKGNRKLMKNVCDTPFIKYGKDRGSCGGSTRFLQLQKYKKKRTIRVHLL